MKGPKVSVVMSAYNEEDSIKRAIDCILGQSFNNFEFIIVDDGSTDNTVKIIKEYQDNRIRLIEKGYNSGLADSLNMGIKYAKGDFIARIDADDYSEKERLEIQVAFLEDNPDVALVGTWAYLIDLNSNTKKESKPPTLDKDIRKYMQKDNPFIHSSIMLRKCAIEKIGYYSLMKGIEDYDLWIRIAKYYKVANIPMFLVTRYENRNLYTRPAYKGLNRYDIYLRRLRCQFKAVKNFGIYPETPWYLLRTIVCMTLCKVGLRR